MRYSDDIIEEVRMKNDIVDVVSQYVKLNKRGSTYFGLCPFHNEKTPSFSVTPAKQMYYCFGCGAGGNVFNFVMEYENYTFGEALKHLADKAGVQLPKIEYSGEAKKKAERRAALLEINKLAAGYFYYQLRRESGRQAHEYLTGRGLSEETIRKFGLGYSDKYSDDLYKYLKSKNYSDELLRDSGLPGMKVLEFAFDSRDTSSYLPHSYGENCICYTGTHDNSPLALWRQEADPADIAFAKEYLGLNDEEGFNRGIIRGGMSSVAKLFVAQMQDYLELGAGHRTNEPGTQSGNWQWRMLPGELTPELAQRIRKLTRIYGRLA